MLLCLFFMSLHVLFPVLTGVSDYPHQVNVSQLWLRHVLCVCVFVLCVCARSHVYKAGERFLCLCLSFHKESPCL